MRFKQIRKIEGIRKVRVNKDTEILVTENAVLDGNHEVLSSGEINPITYWYKDCFYFSTYDGDVYKYNELDKTTILLYDIKDTGITIGKEDKIFLDLTVDNLNYTAVHNITDGSFKKLPYQFIEIACSDSVMLGGIRAFRDVKELKMYDFLKESVLWGVDYSSEKWHTTDDGEEREGQVTKVIGIHEGQVLVQLAPYVLLALDVKTGEELWRTQDFFEGNIDKQYVYYDVSGHTNFNWHLEKEENALYLFARFYGLKIDLITQTIEVVYDLSPESGNEVWDLSLTNKVGDLLYFSGCEDFKAWRTDVGVFDLVKKEVVWSYRCENGGFYMAAPEVSNDKLYIIDNNRNLSIFEKV